MARSPDWYARLDAILVTLGSATALAWLGRAEIGALFGCGERDSIRLLHKFGAAERGNAPVANDKAVDTMMKVKS